MADRVRKLREISNFLFGCILFAIGVAVHADGLEGWAMLFYVLGLSIGIRGAAEIIAKFFFVTVYLLAVGAVFWFYVERTSGLNPAGVFQAHGPDWWSYFWWVPVLVVAGIVAVAVLVYLRVSDEVDGK